VYLRRRQVFPVITAIRGVRLATRSAGALQMRAKLKLIKATTAAEKQTLPYDSTQTVDKRP
jgi:hypothetical protein